jgi:Tfp pilus assembly protein PilN
MLTANLRRWLALGTGVGLEVRTNDLRVTVVRVRPSGAQLVGATTIAGFRERHATQWGHEYAEFLRQHGAAHLTATVLLPRRDVIVRQLSLPGVPKRDLGAAINFQIDALHPFPEGEAVSAWTRLGSAGAVLIGITRQSSLQHYLALFAEAGIKVSAFTFSGAVLHAAIRLISTPPSEGFLALCETEGGWEAYGESAARPLFTATLDLPRDKAAALAAAELRLPVEAEPLEISALLGAPSGSELSGDALSYAAALAGACPWLARPVNLLPAGRRASSSRAMLVPTAVLALILLALLGSLASISPVEDRRYLAALQDEIARLEPQARRAASLDRSIETIRARARLLDDIRRRSKADLDALNELTRLLAPPTWVNAIELTRSSATLNGETEQAGPLLRLIDSSPLFENSEFLIPLARAGKNEVFRIRAAREGATR